jgi:predicted nucleic acid-binding protein
MTSTENAGMLIDTSVLIAVETGRAVDTSSLVDSVYVSTITVGELRSGVMNAATTLQRNQRLETLSLAMDMGPLPVDTHVAISWSLLRSLLRDAGQRMDVNDSWIAATAMAHGMPVVTQDQGFPDLDQLSVIRV